MPEDMHPGERLEAINQMMDLTKQKYSELREGTLTEAEFKGQFWASFLASSIGYSALATSISAPTVDTCWTRTEKV